MTIINNLPTANVTTATNCVNYINVSNTAITNSAIMNSIYQNPYMYTATTPTNIIGFVTSIKEAFLNTIDDFFTVHLPDGKKLLIKGDGSVDYELSGNVVIDSSTFKVKDGTNLLFSDGSAIAVDLNGKIKSEKLINFSEKFIDVKGTTTLYECIAFCHFHKIAITSGSGGGTIELPNGCVIEIFADDSIKIVDKDAKVLYEPPKSRSFNKYLNSSDLIEEFIKYCGFQNIKKSEFMDLPISLFIYWLIVRASEQDKEDPGEAQLLLSNSVKNKILHSHKCRKCGKFLTRRRKEHSVFFCSSEHMETYLYSHNL